MKKGRFPPGKVSERPCNRLYKLGIGLTVGRPALQVTTSRFESGLPKKPE